MSSPPNPGDAIAPPEIVPNNSTVIEDGIPIASSVTTLSTSPSTEILDATSTAPLSETTPVETSPVATPPGGAPSDDDPSVETPSLDTPEEDAPALEIPELEAPVATPPSGEPVESQLLPSDDEDAAATETSLSPSGTTDEVSATPTSTLSSSATEITTATSSEVIPLSDDDAQSDEDDGIVESSQPAPSPIIETLPPDVEASPTDQQQEEATPTNEPAETTAEEVEENNPEATPSAEASPLPIDTILDQDPEADRPTDETEDDAGNDRDRVETIEIPQQDQIVAGPDDQIEDDSRPEDSDGGQDNNDNDENDGGFLGVVPGPTTTGILQGSPTATTLPNGEVSTIRPADGLPSSPDRDSPPSGPSDNGRPDSSIDGSRPAPAVIAGSVIGGVAGLALLLGLLLWFLKRRSDNRHQYVIKTPTFPPPKTSSSEKTWEFDTGSVGPTARSARVVEAVSNHWSALAKVFKPAASTLAHPTQVVAARRRNSKSMEDTLPAPAHSRHNSVNIGPRHSEHAETKNLFTGWWSRGKDSGASSADASQFGVQGNVPKRRSSEIIVGYGARRPLDLRSSRASSEDFAGVLGLMLNKVNADDVRNPFSDNNEVRRNSAQARLSSTNPFNDTYVVDDQLAPLRDDLRGHRPRGSTTGSISTPPPPFARPGAVARDTRRLDTRSNVRSDQFDLEIDGHNASLSLSNGGYNDEVPRRPASVARTQGRESYTSRVVSTASFGSSLDGWGEPGPDVGFASVSQTQQQGRNPERLPYIGEAM